jgi:chromosome segregation ATPase
LALAVCASVLALAPSIGLASSTADAAPASVVRQGSDLAAAAAKAAGDVKVLEDQLTKAKADDVAARAAAVDREAELAAKRDTASSNAEAEKQKIAKLDAELVELDKRVVALGVELKDAEALLASHLANLRSWAAISFINDGKGQFAVVIDPTDLEPRRQTELSRAGAESLKLRVSETKEKIRQIKADTEAAKERIDAAKVDRQKAEEAQRDFELEATVAEEERTLAVEEEFARQQSAEAAQYELSLKITQAQAMATKFTMMGLDESTLGVNR